MANHRYIICLSRIKLTNPLCELLPMHTTDRSIFNWYRPWFNIALEICWTDLLLLKYCIMQALACVVRKANCIPTFHHNHIQFSRIQFMRQVGFFFWTIFRDYIQHECHKMVSSVIEHLTHWSYHVASGGQITPTISLGSNQNIGLHTGARANVVLLTYPQNI